MWTLFGKLSVIPWILFANSSWNMDAVPVITAAQPPSEVTLEVRDQAELFGRGVERRAREVLQRVYREHRIPVQIETIKSLEGAWIADIAQQRGRQTGANVLYVLVAGREQEVGVIAARRGPANRLTNQQRESIRQAFLGPLQTGDADGALEQGVGALAATLDSVAMSKREPSGRDALILVGVLGAALVAVLYRRRSLAPCHARFREASRTARAAAPGPIGGQYEVGENPGQRVVRRAPDFQSAHMKEVGDDSATGICCAGPADRC